MVVAALYFKSLLSSSPVQSLFKKMKFISFNCVRIITSCFKQCLSLPRCTTTICMKVFLPCASLVRIVNLTEIGYDAFFEEIRNDTL